ncbi:bifunctional protein FolD 1 [Populus alba x Populus x berolinensis]|nr:bifunctional protein FolD 1 [Populus alba x Populus x berolinensis]
MMIVRRASVITNIIGHRVNNNCFTTSSSSISSGPILKFPSSLLSLDLPDIWPPSYQAIKNCCTTNDQPSSALVIDGKLIADEIRFRIAEQVRRMKDSVGKVPGLAVILVGDRRDSLTYVRNKVKACEDAGIKSLVTQFPQDCKQDDVIHALSTFNEDPSIHGILVQLPLPQVISTHHHCNALADLCFHSRLWCEYMDPTLIPIFGFPSL